MRILEPGSEALDAIEDHFFAEVNIPYHTDEAIYCFVCHVFSKLNHQTAIEEMLALKDVAEQIRADFGDRCKQVLVDEV